MILEKAVEKADSIEDEKKTALTEAGTELRETEKSYEIDRNNLLADLRDFIKRLARSLPEKNDPQHKARRMFEPIA
ncbi:MAG: hypothetical protein A2V65_10780 [Deltaproteobacteria bacterium RBG_13_49_15]|nr:MAG: hypothetical protein A2V65_10780 [Deltaproteobacteria bacterium RBG_13_49_15]